MEQRVSTSLQHRLVALAGAALAVAGLVAFAVNSGAADGLIAGWKAGGGEPRAKVVERIPASSLKSFTAG